jgi:hypothetical protein
VKERLHPDINVIKDNEETVASVDFSLKSTFIYYTRHSDSNAGTLAETGSKYSQKGTRSAQA